MFSTLIAHNKSPVAFFVLKLLKAISNRGFCCTFAKASRAGPIGSLTNRALGCHGGKGTMRKILLTSKLSYYET